MAFQGVCEQVAADMGGVHGHEVPAVGGGRHPAARAAKVFSQRHQLDARGVVAIGCQQGKLRATGPRAHGEQTGAVFEAHGARGDVFEDVGRGQDVFAQHAEPMAFEPQQPCRFDAVAQNAVAIAAVVRSAEDSEMATVAARVEVHRQRAGIGQHGRLRPGNFLPAAGTRLHPHQPIRRTVLRHADHRERQVQQARMRRQHARTGDARFALVQHPQRAVAGTRIERTGNAQWRTARYAQRPERA